MGITHSEAYGIKKIGEAGRDLFSDVLNGSETLDPASIDDGATATETITVEGATVGDFTLVSSGTDLSGLVCTSYVSAADTVTIVLFNPTGETVDLDSAEWTVKVLR